MLHTIPGLDLPVAILYVERPRAHALDIYRPIDLATFATLGSSLTAILRLTSLGADDRELRRRLTGATQVGAISTRSARMAKVLAQVRALKHSRLPLLITGETGTGKELLARTIHEQSARRDGPFMAFNCAAINESLAEAELFGHLRGAFTDAKRDREGLLAAADGGTLLLDEIGDMPLPLQSKLLRVLQEGVVRPIGSSEPRPIDVRLRAAARTLRIADSTLRRMQTRLGAASAAAPAAAPAVE
jgi:two-component system response regulator GlrR